MFRTSTRIEIRNRFGTSCLACAIVTVALACPRAVAQPRVAIIGDNGGAMNLCAFLEGGGFRCDNLPFSGPTASLGVYQVVIHLGVWTDPNHMLADFVREGKGVVTWMAAPLVLGINTDSVVQAWIGANQFDTGTGQLFTTAMDPILGDLPVGTSLQGPNAAFFSALSDTAGHPGAKVLARFNSGTEEIGILRNSWEGGNSVYFTGPINLGDPIDEQIILNAVRELAAGSIPTVSHWGLTATALLLLAAATILIQRHRIRTT